MYIIFFRKKTVYEQQVNPVVLPPAMELTGVSAATEEAEGTSTEASTVRPSEALCLGLCLGLCLAAAIASTLGLGLRLAPPVAAQAAAVARAATVTTVASVAPVITSVAEGPPFRGPSLTSCNTHNNFEKLH